MSWPDDADGDVLRRLETSGFDFSRDYTVDYSVDFDNWPPDPAALKLLKERYGEIELFAPEEDGLGYVLFRIVGRVTYGGVTSVQRTVTAAMRPFGGARESWGVFH